MSLFTRIRRLFDPKAAKAAQDAQDAQAAKAAQDAKAAKAAQDAKDAYWEKELQEARDLLATCKDSRTASKLSDWISRQELSRYRRN